MSCIDEAVPADAHLQRARRLAMLTTALAIGACSSVVSQQPAAPVTTVVSPSGEMVTVAAVSASPLAKVALPAPGSVRTWQQLRQQVAQRIVAANPNGSYTSTAPDVLLAIPVLEIELNADGSVRRISVLRHPGQAKDTTQLAIDAVRRAAPFGDVSRLSRPWKFSETFLFNDDRLFKPRSLE